MTDNPLLDFSGLPRFDAIRPEHVTPAIEHLLEKNRAAVAQLEAPSDNVTWDNFVTPLENSTELLGRAWGIVSHLNNVVDTPELRATYNENLPKVTEFWTALAQNEALFAKYKALRASAEFAALSPARQRIIDNAIRDFRMGGAELPDDKKERFAAIQEEHAATSTRFSENVLDATNDWKMLVEDEAELRGLPDDSKAAAKALAEKASKAGPSPCTSLLTTQSCSSATTAPCVKQSTAPTPPRLPSWAKRSASARTGTTPAISPPC